MYIAIVQPYKNTAAQIQDNIAFVNLTFVMLCTVLQAVYETWNSNTSKAITSSILVAFVQFCVIVVLKSVKSTYCHKLKTVKDSYHSLREVRNY